MGEVDLAGGGALGLDAVQHQLADSLTELELARLMTYKAAWMQDRVGPNMARISVGSMPVASLRGTATR